MLKGVEDFDPSVLKHAETQEKVVLPAAEGSLLIIVLSSLSIMAPAKLDCVDGFLTTLPHFNLRWENVFMVCSLEPSLSSSHLILIVSRY